MPDALAGRVLLAEGGRERLRVRLGRWAALGDRVGAIGPALLHAHFGTDGALALPLARALGLPLVTTLRGYEVGRSRCDLLRSGRLSWMRYALLEQQLCAGRRSVPRRLGRARAPGRLRGAFRRRDRSRTITASISPASGPARAATMGRRSSMSAGWSRRKAPRSCSAPSRRCTRKCPRRGWRSSATGRSRPRLERLRRAGRSVLPRRAGRGRGRRMDAPRRLARRAEPDRAGTAMRRGCPMSWSRPPPRAFPWSPRDHAGIPEAVEDGKTGFLVPEGAAEPLAAPARRSARRRCAPGADGRGRTGARRDESSMRRGRSPISKSITICCSSGVSAPGPTRSRPDRGACTSASG